MIKEEFIEQIVQEVLSKLNAKQVDKDLIEVEASARHIHLCQKDYEELFGKNNSLTKVSELSQPGQFLAQERITIIGHKKIGHKNKIENIAILGPLRDETQIEISFSDARTLGIEGVLRNSGSIENTPGLSISANGKTINLVKGVIVAKRHIHVNSEDALKLGVQDKDIVSVSLATNRPLIFEDVLVRVSDKFATRMHIDFDEANACGFKPKQTYAKIIRDNKAINEDKSCQQEDIVINKKVLNERDLIDKKLNKNDCLRIKKNTIVTPLAHDYLRNNSVIVIKED